MRLWIGWTMGALGFERAKAAETGRPGYDPRALLKLYLYGYLQQIRSSRRLESECRRNIELADSLPCTKPIRNFRSAAVFFQHNPKQVSERLKGESCAARLAGRAHSVSRNSRRFAERARSSASRN